MSVNLNSANNFASGLNQPFVNVFQAPVVTNRNPTTNDKAPLGTMWVNQATNAAYVATSIAANAVTWTNFGGGAGVFSSLTVNPGDLVVTAGNLNVTAGIISTSAGHIQSQTDVIAIAGELIVGGDTGAVTAGLIGVTNVTNTTQGTGVLSILSTTNNPGDNTGFIKIYIGGTTAYIPYFTNIAP